MGHEIRGLPKRMQRFPPRNKWPGGSTLTAVRGHLQLAPDPALDEHQSRSPIRLVLADDHAAVRRNLRLLLEREDDIEVVAEATDISAVMRHVADHSPQVVVLDLRLPNGSSLGAVRRLRSEVPDTRVVILTMEESPAFAQQALDAGAIAFVCKDRADDELPDAIRCGAAGTEYISPRVAAALEAISQGTSADGLTPRETEILRLIALGHTSAEIAQKLHLSRRTVETHRARIHSKLGMSTRAELVRYALGRHLIGN